MTWELLWGSYLGKYKEADSVDLYFVQANEAPQLFYETESGTAADMTLAPSKTLSNSIRERSSEHME